MSMSCFPAVGFELKIYNAVEADKKIMQELCERYPNNEDYSNYLENLSDSPNDSYEARNVEKINAYFVGILLGPARFKQYKNYPLSNKKLHFFRAGVETLNIGIGFLPFDFACTCIYYWKGVKARKVLKSKQINC